MNTFPGRGIHQNVPFEDYLRWPLMSQSVLKEGRVSMLHLHDAFSSQSQTVPTDEMVLGSALHTAFLTPDLLDTRVVEWQGKTRYGKEWDAFKEEHQDKAILTPGFYRRMLSMVTALRGNKFIREWTTRRQIIEASCVGTLAGTPMKGRADMVSIESHDAVVDIKSASSLEDRAIEKAIDSFGYHIQGFVYCRLFGRRRFLLGFVESSAPFDVRVVELGEDWLRIGERETMTLLQRYQFCVKAGHFPGVSETLDTLEAPAWATERYASEITIDGKPAF